jgi:hypothetical protein
LAVAALEGRDAPAVFRPLAAAPDGSPHSLRADIIRANRNHQDNTILLQRATYDLTIANGAGQDNAAARGDLDLTGRGHTVTFIGRGAATVINANHLDRVFQVFPGVHVVFRNLTITGGLARDDGTAGAAAGTTDALGGGLLSQGGTVTLERVRVTGNAAVGANGHNGQGGGLSSRGCP